MPSRSRRAEATVSESRSGDSGQTGPGWCAQGTQWRPDDCLAARQVAGSAQPIHQVAWARRYERSLGREAVRGNLATLLYYGLRRGELCDLRVGDLHSHRGVPHLPVRGNRRKQRYIPLHPRAATDPRVRRACRTWIRLRRAAVSRNTLAQERDGFTCHPKWLWRGTRLCAA